MNLPFDPLPLRHGVDLVDIPELRAVMDRNPSFAERVFTEAERAYCGRFPDPAPHYAVRFAAKEAVLKALGIGITPIGIDRALGEIEVVRDGSAPRIALRGRPARRAERLGVGPAAVSLSHTGTMALASVVMPVRSEGEPS